MPGYIVYLDAWLIRLLANFIFEYLLLSATAEVTRCQTTKVRLTIAAVIGTSHYFLFLLASLSMIPFYGLLRFFPVILLVSVVMVVIAFYPLNIRKLGFTLGHFYGIGFGSAGAGIAAAYLFGSPGSPNQNLGVIVSIVTILVIAELGWGLVQKRIFHYVYQLPVEIYLNERSVGITALVDTGNKLKDPLTQKPVIIVEHTALAPLFDQDIQELIAQLEPGNLQGLTSLVNHSQLASRFRLLPFTSIGKEHGMLIGFRPDKIRLLHEDQIQYFDNVVVGIHRHKLDPDGLYQGLIPPEILQQALQNPSETRTVEKGGRSHAASTHPKI